MEDKIVVNNLTKYKKALILRRDITEALNELENSVLKLKKYTNLLQIREILAIIGDNAVILKVHLKAQQEIIDNQGFEKSDVQNR